MKETNKYQAIIYCRVSSVKQVSEGHGLGSQETRCREYAAHKRYDVVQVYRDEGVSGGLIDRPGMQEMLSFLRKHRKRQQHVVIIDDISRLARGLEAHLQLRAAISEAGGKLESPSIEFGEDSDSILVENLLASVSQHQRQKNGEQTRNRMRARVMNGYWVFAPPVGYRFENVNGHGSMLVRDEPIASIVAEALEGFASGRFDTQAEVKRFLESFPEFPKNRAGEVRNQQATDMLTRVLYAGYIEMPDWGIRLQPAKHEPLISFATYQAIQERLNGSPKVPTRKDISEDFPLRGFVTCGHCGTPLTACWSKGRSTVYPYYLCPKRGCEAYGKSVRRETMHGEFEARLSELQPSKNVFLMARELLREHWEDGQTASQARSQSLESQLRKIERQVDHFLDRIAETDSPALIASYENRIRSLEEQKALLGEKLRNRGQARGSFETALRTALQFLGNPQNLWLSDRLEDKRMVLKLAFATRLPYVRNQGFRTAIPTLPFKVLGGLRGSDFAMASPAGFEPATLRLGI